MEYLEVDYTDKSLFGSDIADTESDEVFAAYALERPEVKEFLDGSNPIQVVRAYKGEGKSALLRIVKNNLLERAPNSIVINTTGVDLSPACDSSDSDFWTREWKKKILHLAANEIGKRIGWAFTDDAISLVEEAELNGFKERSFVSSIVDRLQSSKVPIQRTRITQEDREQTLKRWLHKKEPIWLIIDDVDQNFVNTDRYKLKIAAYFTACRQIVTAIPELKIRTCVRPNVWKIIKREFEALSHIEQFMQDLTWTPDQITELLAKRVQGYFERKGTWKEVKKHLPDALDVRNKRLIYLVFDSPMAWGGNNRKRPAEIILNSLSRGRPRWLVELCTISAETAFKRKANRISIDDIINELEEFGKRRIDDTIAEFSSQCPAIEEILTAFSQQNERYQTDELMQVIGNHIENKITIKIFGILGAPNKREIAHFLYQIGFITARRDFDNGEYKHISFVEQPDLFKSRLNIDDGVSWEIHPVFRQALKLKNVETKQQKKWAQRK
ncbi:P-loop ATPase, Sll1717 family [Endozoicomonas arenosclerae]|uniref:P-loop ATPase, Sll1717 family n=1 Tax=Endozoicomonas arenosclerae TaxID=1633495 RepID=UPI000783A6CA|nr:hypothetical protein [Endozoicomonas arenosclerae]